MTGKEIAEWFNKPFVVLDTETTGLERKDQIIEIAVLDQHKNTLLNTRLKPTCNINPEAGKYSRNSLLMNYRTPLSFQQSRKIKANFN